ARSSCGTVPTPETRSDPGARPTPRAARTPTAPPPPIPRERKAVGAAGDHSYVVDSSRRGGEVVPSAELRERGPPRGSASAARFGLALGRRAHVGAHRDVGLEGARRLAQH